MSVLDWRTATSFWRMPICVTTILRLQVVERLEVRSQARIRVCKPATSGVLTVKHRGKDGETVFDPINDLG